MDYVVEDHKKVTRSLTTHSTQNFIQKGVLCSLVEEVVLRVHIGVGGDVVTVVVVTVFIRVIAVTMGGFGLLGVLGLIRLFGFQGYSRR